MNNQVKRNSSERGVALIFALVTILVLSFLAATVMFTSQSQTWTSLNYRQTAQARYAAEAGVQATINWLGSIAYPTPSASSFTTTTYPVQYNGQPVVLSSVTSNSNYPDSTVVDNFAAVAAGTVPGIPNATYTTTATLTRITTQAGVPWLQGPMPQTWQITSVGKIQGVTTSSVQMVETFERMTAPVFTNGLETTSTGCGAIKFGSSGSYTDSYNSNNGPYSSTNSQASGGNIATNGNVYLGSGVKVNGTITAENTIVNTTNQGNPCTNGVTNASGKNPFDLGTYKMPATLVAPLPWGCAAQPCYPPGALTTIPSQDLSTSCTSTSGCTKNSPATITINDGGTTKTGVNSMTLAPGAYGDITIDNADVVHVSAGIYTINSLNFGNGDGQIVIDSGPVVFNMAGNCTAGHCPTESGLPSGYSSTEVVHGSGLAGLNACAPSGGKGVVANPGVYGLVTCGGVASGSNTLTGAGVFSGIPANMQFVYGGTNTVRLGGMPFAAAIYAPAATYYTPGAPVGLYGSLIAKAFDDESGSPWHYDNALGQAGMKVGGYKSLGLSWSKF